MPGAPNTARGHPELGGFDAGWRLKVMRALHEQPLLSLEESLDALAGAGLTPQNIADLKYMAAQRIPHLRHVLDNGYKDDNGILTHHPCPHFNIEYAQTSYLWTIEDPLKLYEFINTHLHSTERKKGPGGMSLELRACMPFVKVCCSPTPHTAAPLSPSSCLSQLLNTSFAEGIKVRPMHICMCSIL